MTNLLAQLQNWISSPVLSSALVRRGGIIAAAIFGIIYCLYGYKLMRFISTVVGAVIGCAAGYVVAGRIDVEGTQMLVAVLIGAVALGLLGFFIEKFGVFIMVFVAGYGVTTSLAVSYTTFDAVIIAIVSLVVGLVLAILSMIYMRPLIIVATSLLGGMMFSNEVFSVVKIAWSAQLEMYIHLGVGLVLAVIGIIYQFRSTRNMR